MATQLFLRDILVSPASPISDFVNDEALTPDRGDGANNFNTATVASGNHVQMGDPSNSTVWMLRVNAVTISGTITFNFWMAESNMSANIQAACRIARYDSAGSFVSDVVANANANHADGVELPVTTPAAMSWTATPTSTSFAAGDWLVIIPHFDAIGTMASGHLGNITYDASSSGVSGDSYVTFTETITEYVAITPHKSPYPQILAQ